MISCRTIILLAVIGFTIAEPINLYIEPNDDDNVVVDLLPEVSKDGSRTKNTWNITACDSCKLGVKCGFYKTSCEEGVIIIVAGNDFFHMCPEYGNPSFDYPTPGNTMLITIENVGKELTTRCEIKSTKPYIGIGGDEGDSREHGLEVKSKEKPTCRCGWSNKPPGRIVNGTIAGIHEYPFAVRLMETESRVTFCGGSIITSKIILTAAHCTYPRLHLQLSVLIGEHDIITMEETPETREGYAAEIIIHPEYNPSTLTNDISLMILHGEIEFNDMVGPVCMPTAQNNLIGQYVKVMGWGNLADLIYEGEYSTVLRKVNVRVIEMKSCKVVHAISHSNQSQFCTYNVHKDSCQGDSGGPLVRVNPKTNMFEQVGLVSFGRVCASSDPAVNTDVAYFVDWIKEQIKAKAPGELCF